MWWASAPARRTGARPPPRAALEAATDWVGYGLYLDLVADVKSGQQEHRFPLGGEEDRVRHAIELAKQGKEVALICSGDAGIYAMAALVYEVIDLEPVAHRGQRHPRHLRLPGRRRQGGRHDRA